MTFAMPHKAKTKPIRAVFVLTPGRSGSMWLAWALQQVYYSVVALHEPGVMVKDLAFQYYHDTAAIDETVNALRKAKLPAIEAARLYMKKTHYIEVNRNLFPLANPLRYAVTSEHVSVTFLGLVGDGRVFVRSMANKNAYVDPRPYGWFEPLGHPNWESYSQIEKLSYHWVEKIRLINLQKCLVFRIEDLTRSRLEWNTLALSLKLPMLRSDNEYARVANTRQNHTPCNKYKTFNDIPAEDRDRFWTIAGGTMKDLGYV